MSGKYALIIGNTDYSDPGLARLTAPGKDAADFARILQDRNICGFDEVRSLSNELSSSVIEAMDEFFDLRKPDDLLILYFSGHGIRDEFGSLYLAFKNTIRSRLRSTAIKAEYVREAMDQSRSKRQLLILDCCNSGAFPQGAKAEVGGAMGMVSTFQGYGRYVLTASDATQYAWEGDKVIGGTQNSLFTHFLIRGLEGAADRDSDGKISIDELYDYAFEEISRATPQQTPTKFASKQEGDIILRQITRMQDIRPVALPEELLEAIEDSRTFVRVSAVEELEKLLRGRNLGLARSAREVLEKVAEQDDSNRVRQLAAQSLKSLPQPGQEIVPGEVPAEAAGMAAEPRPEQRETDVGTAKKPRTRRPAGGTPVVGQAAAAQAKQASVPVNVTVSDRPVPQEAQPDRGEMRAARGQRGLSAWINIAGLGESSSDSLIRIGAAGAAVVVIALVFFVLRSIGAPSRQSSTPPAPGLEASVLSASSATAAPVAVVAGSATTEPAQTSSPGGPTSTPGDFVTLTPEPAVSSTATSAPVLSIYVPTPPFQGNYVVEGQWSKAVLAAALPHGNVYLMNDYESIYMLIDVVGDTVNDLYNGTITSDALDVGIDANNDMKLGVDDFIYRFSAGAYGGNGLELIKRESWFQGDGCTGGGITYDPLPSWVRSYMWLGFDSTPNLHQRHRFYVLRILMDEISVKVGDTVRLAVRYYSNQPHFNEGVPPSLWDDCNMTGAIAYKIAGP